MFSVGKLAAGGERYYLDSVARGVEDYYLGVGEAPGQWLGSAGGELGLWGEVADGELVAVLGGRHPQSGAGLVSGKAAAVGRVPGFDVTLSAPKSVSLLFALGDEALSGAVRDAHDRAVVQALGFLESEAARVRRGRGGVVVEPAAGGLVAAGFRHRTSRAGDPQLHTHVLVANLGRGEDGRWSALDARGIYTHGKTASLLYQAALRAELTRALGVGWGPVRQGIAEVTGFRRGELLAFSQRRVEIEARLAAVGASSAKAAQAAALDTRQAKSRGQRVDAGPLAGVNARDYGVEPPLVEGWRRRGEEIGLDRGRVAGLVGRPREPGRPDLTGLAAELAGPSGLTERASTFDRRDVLQALAAACPEGADVAALRAAADWFVGLPGLVRVEAAGHLRSIDAIRRGDGKTVVAETGPRWTTADLVAVETGLLAAGWDRRGAGVGVAGPDAVGWALASRPTLGGEQKAMVERLCASGAGVEVVVGVAGAGKTFALEAARAAWEHSGIPVIGAALSARAAQELSAGSGIESTTLARLLADASRPEGRLPPGTVVVVDEASMVGTRSLARLVELTGNVGGKLVLVGDPRQLPEIDAGGAFNALAGRLGASVLVENRRQVEGWERAALSLVRSGRAAEAVAIYGEHGRIHLAPSAGAARAALVADWWAARAGHPGEEAVMLAGRRSDIDRLNAAARAVRKDAGELAGAELVAAGRPFAVGDDILALANDRRLGIVNGDRGQVTAINADAGTLTVALPARGDRDQRQTELPGDYLAAGRLGHGYAMTVYKAQGMTAGRTFTLGTDTLSGEEGYVALSRGRVANHLYAVTPTPPTRTPSITPVRDPLVEALARSRAQRLATDALPDVRVLARGHSIGELEDQAAALEVDLRRGLPPDRSQELAAARYNVTNAQAELAAAHQTRAELAARLEHTGRLHPAQRAALTAQLQAADAAAAGWARTLAIHQPRLDQYQANQAGRQQWLQDHAGDLERHAALQQAVAARRGDLTTAATLNPPRWLLQALGAYPDNRPQRRIWRDAAGDILAWRDRHNISDPEDPLGPPPLDAIQALTYRQLAHYLDHAARRLDHHLAPEPGHQFGIENDRGPDIGR